MFRLNLFLLFIFLSVVLCLCVCVFRIEAAHHCLIACCKNVRSRKSALFCIVCYVMHFSCLSRMCVPTRWYLWDFTTITLAILGTAMRHFFVALDKQSSYNRSPDDVGCGFCIQVSNESFVSRHSYTTGTTNILGDGCVLEDTGCHFIMIEQDHSNRPHVHYSKRRRRFYTQSILGKTHDNRYKKTKTSNNWRMYHRFVCMFIVVHR